MARWHTGGRADWVSMEAVLTKIYFWVSTPQPSKHLFSVIVEDNTGIKMVLWKDFWDVFTYSFLNRAIQKLDEPLSSLCCPVCGWDNSETYPSTAAEWSCEFNPDCAGVNPRAHLLLALKLGALWRRTMVSCTITLRRMAHLNYIFLIIQTQKGVLREESLLP